MAESTAVNVLSIDHLKKSFGSLVVTDDVTLTIAEGERHVIIGPNGAGKTSLINQIGGQLEPSAGRIFVKQQDITGWPPHRISRIGVARTFQRNNLSRIYASLWRFVSAIHSISSRRSGAMKACSSVPGS
jgi:branched-chain amino acid transport system ATP-binding protein